MNRTCPADRPDRQAKAWLDARGGRANPPPGDRANRTNEGLYRVSGVRLPEIDLKTGWSGNPLSGRCPVAGLETTDMSSETRRRRWTAADAMFGEPRGSFRAWILAQAGRDDAVGEVARSVWRDQCLGRLRAPHGIEVHILVYHSQTLPEGDQVFVENWRAAVGEWSRSTVARP